MYTKHSIETRVQRFIEDSEWPVVTTMSYRFSNISSRVFVFLEVV